MGEPKISTFLRGGLKKDGNVISGHDPKEKGGMETAGNPITVFRELRKNFAIFGGV